MMKYFLAVTLLWLPLSVYSFDSREVEYVIKEHFRSLSECEIELSIEKISYVSDTGHDYTEMKPSILPTDIETHILTKLCDVEDQYFVWLRENNGEYKVITYTSFTQPE